MYDKEYVNNIIYTSVAPLCIFSHSPIPNIFPFQQPIYQYLLMFKARELEGINCMDGRLYNNFATITFYRKEANYSKAGSSNNDFSGFQIICKSKWPIAWAADHYKQPAIALQPQFSRITKPKNSYSK